MAIAKYFSPVQFRTLTLLFASVLTFLPLCNTAWASQNERTLHLRNERIVTPPKAAQPLGQPPERVTGERLHLIQFEGSIQPEWREALRALGVDLLTYVPDDAFIANIGTATPGQLRRLDFIRWIGPYKPAYKVHSDLRQGALGEGSSERLLNVSVLLAPRAGTNEMTRIEAMLRGKGTKSRLPQGTILRGRLPSGRLSQLSESDAVLWVEPAAQMALYDEEAAKIVGGDDGLRSTPTLTQQLGYDGSGVVVAVADTGLDSGDAATMHPDLAGRVDAFYQYGSLTDASDHHSHGTHVAGIISGNAAVGEADSNGALYGLGVASGSHIVAQRIFDGAGQYQPPPSFEALTRDAISAGADIGNNSWGDDNQGRYDLSAMEFDALVRDADASTPGDQAYILEFSSGNAGPGDRTVGTPAVAKNVITSGASQNNRSEYLLYSDGQESMADFSSRGPCEDGRLKPDMVAPGTWIASLRSVFADDNNAWAGISANYLYQGGTSQAGPQISGAAAVLVQFYRATHGGATPSPALVKGALINSSVDMDDGFGTSAIPNDAEGWGRVDLTRVIGSPRTTLLIDQTNLLMTGASYETTIVVEDHSEPLKITLAYTDVPGFAGAIPALVNDLDLEVTGPDGTVYRGNRFYDGDSIPNPSSADRINNVEGVHLLTPQAGEYHVRVLAHSVAEDARVETPAVDQDFALVISGLLLPAGKSVIYMDRTAYSVPGTINVGVIDRDEAGQASVSVSISSDTESGGETLTLVAAGGGLFTNSIPTATGAASVDGLLQLAHGDTITAGYFDASAGTARSATALGDLLPPVITGVGSTNRFGVGSVLWTTDEPASTRVEYGTNSLLNLEASIPGTTTNHVVSLDDLVSGTTYYYRVISTDVAGNTSTNDNGGSLFTLVAPNTLPVLLVDAYYNGSWDYLFFPPPPISNYTQPLTQLGVPFDYWNHESSGSPSLEVLRSYRVVIWRLPELNFVGVDPYPTFTPSERAAIAEYLNEGGSFFVSSMEVLTRLGEVGAEDFRADVLHVVGFDAASDEDATVPSVSGVSGDPITDGMDLAPDYWTDYNGNDLSDTFTPSASAAGIFTEDLSGKFAGLRYPGPGVDAPGRLVFLSFPFDAIPTSGPNNRSDVLRKILQFLAPGITGEAVVSTDRSAYSIPSVITVEVGDVDLEGAGSITVTGSTTTEPVGKSFVLDETARLGLFQGQIRLVHATNSPATNQLRAVEGDTVIVRYFDPSIPGNVEASAMVDVTPPAISGVSGIPSYSTAVISWDTDEPCDSLVQFGESLPLPVNRTQFSPALTTSHELTLAALEPTRTYYYQVVSRDAAGNSTVDDNGGSYYSFTTLTPLDLPLADSFETGGTNWSVFSEDYSESQWSLGVPNNGVETVAHSPANAWGSILNGGSPSLIDTYLISPGIHLTGGNQITLRFWHSYEFTSPQAFDIISGGEVLLIDLDNNEATPLVVYYDNNAGWEQETIDLTPYLGKVVCLAWHHQLFSFDYEPRGGWLVDDVQVTADTINAGTVTVSNNLSQASFVLTGPTTRNGSGIWSVVSNAPAGPYILTFNPVAYYATPPPQTNSLLEGGILAFTAAYTFDDINTNGISDAWEQTFLGSVAPLHPGEMDSDLDGMCDRAEFIAGTNPTNAASCLSASLKLQPNALLLLQWPTTSGRSYLLESSSDLLHWTPLIPWTRANGSSLSQLLNRPPVATLYRVQVRP